MAAEPMWSFAHLADDPMAGFIKVNNPARDEVSLDTQYAGTGEYLYGYYARPCPHNGCGRPHRYSSGYCELHKKHALGWFDGGPVFLEQPRLSFSIEPFIGPLPRGSIPMQDDVVAGALFDFIGFLTTRQEATTLGAQHESPAALELLTEWAEARGLDLTGAMVDTWNDG